MNKFLAKPSIQKSLSTLMGYIVFAVLAILALGVVYSLHSAIFRISLMATTQYGVGNFFYVWGAFILFAIYVVVVVVIESVVHAAAKNGRLMKVGLLILAIEGGLWLLTVIALKVAQWIYLPA